MSMVQGTGNPSPTVLSYYIPCRRGRVSRPRKALPKWYEFVDMPLARLDIFALQNRYIAKAIRYDINPSCPAGHIECYAHIERKAHIENPERDLYR